RSPAACARSSTSRRTRRTRISRSSSWTCGRTARRTTSTTRSCAHATGRVTIARCSCAKARSTSSGRRRCPRAGSSARATASASRSRRPSSRSTCATSTPAATTSTRRRAWSRAIPCTTRSVTRPASCCRSCAATEIDEMKAPFVPLLLLAAASALAQEPPGEPAHQQRESLKIYISADMEGVAGVVTDEQLGPGGFEYERFRELMTAEVNACIEAAREAGATEVLVSDSHGNGQNLLVERLPADVTIVRSWPRHLGMMAGIDASFDGVILLGYHASTANERGVRAHTFSSANVTAFRLNGTSMSEAGMSAAIAGHFGVPVIMVSGDQVAVAETQVIVGDVEGAVVK